MNNTDTAVRYLVDDVQAAVDFYTTHLGFTLNMNAAPAIAQVTRGPMRLLLSGPTTSGARATPDDLKTAGRNRIHLIFDDLDTEVDRLLGEAMARLSPSRAAAEIAERLHIPRKRAYARALDLSRK